MRKLNRSGLVCFAVALFVLVLAGCESVPSTNFAYDREVDYARYETFAWIGEHPLSFHTMVSHVAPLLENQLMQAARELLEDRGLRFVEDPSQADLLAAFSVGSRQRIITDGYSVPAISGDETSSTYWPYTSNVLGSFVEGQVCLDLFDVERQRPVWHGTVREPLIGPDVEYWQESARRILTLIVAGYPPAPD